MALNLETGPALENFTFEFDDDGGVMGVGATCRAPARHPGQVSATGG